MSLQKDLNEFHKAFDNMVKIMKKEKFIQKVLFWGLLFGILNLSITSFIYRFKHPEKTETQTFLHIPESFQWNFK